MRFPSFGEFVESMSNSVSFVYSGAVLAESERDRLWNHVVAQGKIDPVWQKWQRKCHHMTTNLGYIDSGPAAHLDGQEVTLRIDAVAVDPKSLKVAAVRVVEGPPVGTGKTPHVTLSVGPGGAAKNSGDLTDWVEIEPIEVKAKVGSVEVQKGRGEVLMPPGQKTS